MCHLKPWAWDFAKLSFHICLKVQPINTHAIEIGRCYQFSPTLPFQKHQLYCKQAETLPLELPLRRITRGWQHWRMVGVSTKMRQLSPDANKAFHLLFLQLSPIWIKAGKSIMVPTFQNLKGQLRTDSFGI